MAKLNEGKIPWIKPWKNFGINPINFYSKTEYRGSNLFILSHFETPYFLTYKQVKMLGGHLKKGAKSIPVIYWNFVDSKVEAKKKIPFLKYYNVFNAEDIEGIEFPNIEIDRSNFNPIDSAKKLLKEIKGTHAKLNDFAAQKACYSPSKDKINMPLKYSFVDSQAYYATLYHEIGHSIGHISRLNRKTLTELSSFGSHEYSKEELVAEMFSAYLCSKSGIDKVMDNAASYIQGWLSVLKNDKNLFINACTQAKNACNYVFKQNEKQEGGENE